MGNTRRLYLVRHAQAAAAAVGAGDYDRPLDGQGEADARALSAMMEASGYRPDLVVCSGAARTRGTLACLAGPTREAEVRFDDSLYDGSVEDYLAAASASGAGDVMLIGHNPMVASLARSLATSGDRHALDVLSRGLPTCALALFRLEGSEDLSSAVLEELSIPPHRVR